MRAVQLILAEGQRLWRAGIPLLFLGLPFLWGMLSRILERPWKQWVLLGGGVMDLCVMGTLFTGALFLREKSWGITRLWRITPMSLSHWLTTRLMWIIGLGILGAHVLLISSGTSLSLFQYVQFMASTSVFAAVGALIGMFTATLTQDTVTYTVIGGSIAGLLSCPPIGDVMLPSWLWGVMGPMAPACRILMHSLELSQTPHSWGWIPPTTIILFWMILMICFTKQRILSHWS